MHGAGQPQPSPIVERVLVLVDGLCPYHGGYLAARATEIRNVAVIHVLSDYLRGYLRKLGTESEEDLERMRMPVTEPDVRAWKDYVGHNAKFVAVYCESDSGLADAEGLRELLHTDCRDEPPRWEARRNKFLMQQAVGAVGLATAKQRLCESAVIAREFAHDLLATGNHCVIVKPFRGVASESVYLCQTTDEVQAAWDKITATQVFGSAEKHSNVLIQEYLDGVEYAVDTVSREGEHKVAAIWRYVKQPANGAAFCYFKTELIDSAMDNAVEDICTYISAALNALGVKWGITHSEVIIPKDDDRGPVLVEVNCRQHNMDFLPLTMACIGYNAFDMMLAAMLGDYDDWTPYPDLPALRAHGCMVHLVNYASGRLKQSLHLPEMADLSSVFDYEVYEQFRTPGEQIKPTVDIRSDAGWAQLINEDPDTLRRDYEQIVEWMPTMFETEHDID